MKKPFIVGIAGGSASGKSTFSEALKDALQGLEVRVIHMDSYFRPDKERPVVKAPITGRSYLDDNHPMSMDLDKMKRDLAETADSGRFQVIIAEGLLTLWDKEIYDKLDLRLFIDCRADERIVRRLKRNMQWGLTFDEIADVYLDLVRYRHDEYVEPSKWRADFILNGSAPSERALAMIVAYVRSLC